MNNATFPAWFETAKSEHLLDAFLADPARFKDLDEALSLLPSDRARLLYLRATKKLKIEPDDPNIFQGIINTVISSEMTQAGLEEFLDKMAQAENGALVLMQTMSEQVGRVRRQAERMESVQEKYEKDIGTQLATIERMAKALPEDMQAGLKTVVASINEMVVAKTNEAVQTAVAKVAAATAYAATRLGVSIDGIRIDRDRMKANVAMSKGGIIAEHGSFTELLRKGGIFAELYRTQFADRDGSLTLR